MHVLTPQTKLLEFIGKRKDSRLEIHISSYSGHFFHIIAMVIVDQT